MNRPASILLLIISIITIISTPGCGSGQAGKDTDRSLEIMKRFWHDKLSAGEMDSVVYVTRKYYNNIKGSGSDAEALAGLQLSQAFTILENKDSAEKYLSEIAPLAKDAPDPMARLLYHHIKGSLALKYRLSYPEALSSFHEGYREARKAGNQMAMVTMLANIGYIYYILDDPNGMDYAREGVSILSTADADIVSRSQAYMGLALMQVTNNMYPEALATLDHIDSLILEHDLRQLAPLSFTTRGDILSRQGRLGEAEKEYRKAIELREYAEPSFGVLALMRYGRLKERQKDLREAERLYSNALAISMSFRNLEFRADIILALAKLHSRLGNKEEALSFFHQYHNLNDSLQKNRMVQDFNSLVTTNLRLEKGNEVHKYKIRNLRTQRIATICISLLTVLTVVLISMAVTHRRQRKLHEATVRRLLDNRPVVMTGLPEGAKEETKAAADDSLRDVFQNIECKMRTEKAYRDSNISLESLAASLGSNRTYVSKAVNACAGVSFSRYINAFRISDAMAILSDHTRDVRVKELAAELGFSSDSVFSKTFKKDVGMSPMEFRKSALSIAKNDGIS